MASGIRETNSLTVQERHTLPLKTYTDEGLAEDESDLTPLEDEVEAPKKHPRTRKKRATVKNVTVEGSKSTNTRGAPKRTTSQVVENVTDSEVPPKKRKRACKPEPVYVIPDVDNKVTTFRGRLGYACLNTVLRNKKPASEAIFCSRTCRINTIKNNGVDWVKDLGKQNAEDMLKIIEWNEKNSIRFMRISSEMFPFASHETYGYSLEYCSTLLAQVGALAKRYGHRLTTHPGQFTQLGSPRESVVRSSIRELEYHAEMLDRMGIDPDGVMIIHGGGVYGDKAAALARMKSVIQHKLSARVRARLVLENDELCYNAADLLPVCTELGVPLVFDYHHDTLNPSPGLPPSAIMAQANEIFRRRGIRPKQHYSEPRTGAVSIMQLRAHSDRCDGLPEGLPDDMDLMIEAKDKEQAVLHLYRMYDLHPVIHASLRPPAAPETNENKGRKSARKTRSQKQEIDDSAALETGIGIEGDEVDEKGTFVDSSRAFTQGTTLMQDTMSSGRSRSDSGEIHTSSIHLKAVPRKRSPRTKGKKGQKKAILLN